ncbi:FxSxx-COOH system tetratricopeptide repeat protein [Streptomyces sp. NPDC050504]|uniref:FxSxx-COOH system tetratricopeptide repeat protein n=1 Tax=Streptomyces sp. NPDC050504 TaxID=3365618 RepID=UPI0037973081
MEDRAGEPDFGGRPTDTGGPGRDPGGADAIQVRNNLSGTVHGAVVQAGSIGTLINHAPPASPRGDVIWPLRIGAVPDTVTAHQPRTALRERIHHAQDSAGTVVLSQVLSGGGGVGKTQLAAALAHEAGGEGTDLVLWANAARPEQILGAYATAAVLVRAPGTAGQDVEADARAFLNWAAATSRSWLMVLDDVTEPAELRGWWPPTSTGTVRAGSGTHRAVITTRLKGADISGGGRRVLDVAPFTAAESAAFLRERLAGDEAEHLLDDAVDEVGAVLGQLPLALGYAAAWMINEDQPCTAYVEHFRDQEQRLVQVLPAGGSGEAYDREVAAALLLSLRAAQAAEPVGLAAPALGLAAHLDPAGHPAELWLTDAVAAHLARARSADRHGAPGRERDRGADAVPPAASARGTGGVDGEGSAVAVSAGTARRAMRLLHRYGLVTIRRDDPQRAVRIHALTARAAREALPAAGENAVVRAAADALLELWPDEDHHDLARAGVLRANVDHLWPLAGDHLWRPGRHPLLYRAGDSHRRNGLPAAAVTYWEHQVGCAERLLEADHPDILTTRAYLAAGYWSAGRTTEAVALSERVVVDRRRVLGDRHPDTLVARANLAAGYWTVGRSAEAITLFEEVLADSEHVFGDQHAETLRTRANLAVGYRTAGRVEEAVALEEQVLAGRMRLLGDRHPDTLLARGNLAASYWTAGRTAEAITLFEEVLADSEDLLGDQHSNTLHARANLAFSYRTAGRGEEAITIEEQVLADRERLLGPEHPHTLHARSNLAASYWSVGRVEEAITLEEEVLADRERLLGETHPDTLTARSSLAVSYWTAGRTAEAVALQEEALAQSERVLGEGHPDTVERLQDLRRWYELNASQQ